MVAFSEKKLSKLRTAIGYSRRQLQPFRQQRYDTVRQYVGYHYSDDGAADRVPLNLLELAVNIYTQQLAARSPQVIVNTPFRELRPQAATFELGLNQLLKEIRFGDTVRMAVIDALFSIGIIKTGLERRSSVEIDGYLHDVGQPFADIISLDNWVHDTTATRLDKCQFMGDRYRLPLELVKKSSAFTNTDQLKATTKTSYNEDGDSKTESLSHGSQVDPDEYAEHIELWDIWLPAENIILTIPAEGESKPIRVIQWDGPENGPYHLLSFSPVPGNIMPLAPSALWMDLHDLANRMFRKLGRQAERQKTVLGVQAGAEDDGNRIISSNDGETLRLDNPDRAREYPYGGAEHAETILESCLSISERFGKAVARVISKSDYQNYVKRQKAHEESLLSKKEFIEKCKNDPQFLWTFLKVSNEREAPRVDQQTVETSRALGASRKPVFRGL